MKKLNLKLTLAFLIGINIFSCSSGDDSNITNQDDLVGIWNLVSIENQGNNVMVIDCQTEQNIIYNSDDSGTEKAPEEISRLQGDWCPCRSVQIQR